MSHGTAILLWTVFLFLLLALLPIFEVWLLKRAGVDIVAHLRVTLTEGKKWKIFFEAFGAIAFIMAQPFFLLLLFVRISDEVARRFMETIQQFVV